MLGRILSIGFLNTGTYDRDVATYKVIDNPTGPLSQEKEWQLFRHWARDERKNWQAGQVTQQHDIHI